MGSGFSGAGALLRLQDGGQAIAAVVGCGGKTTLIESIAREYSHRKVLVTPTTKIWPMHGIAPTYTTPEECLLHRPVQGLQCMGVMNDASGKLEALPLELLERLISQYDLVLIEADGSRGLPCKGWQPDEPVVPGYCTDTIGVATLGALGRPADEDAVLRLPEFLALTGLQRGESVSLRALTDMVCADQGMFRCASGRQSILINQVEDGDSAAVAEDWLKSIRQAYPGRFACLAYGSARANEWKEV